MTFYHMYDHSEHFFRHVHLVEINPLILKVQQSVLHPNMVGIVWKVYRFKEIYSVVVVVVLVLVLV
jgi:hypothetical protein